MKIFKLVILFSFLNSFCAERGDSKMVPESADDLEAQIAGLHSEFDRKFNAERHDQALIKPSALSFTSYQTAYFRFRFQMILLHQAFEYAKQLVELCLSSKSKKARKEEAGEAEEE